MRSRVIRRFLKISGTDALIASLLLSVIWVNLAILVGHLRHGNYLVLATSRSAAIAPSASGKRLSARRRNSAITGLEAAPGGGLLPPACPRAGPRKRPAAAGCRPSR